MTVYSHFLFFLKRIHILKHTGIFVEVFVSGPGFTKLLQCSLLVWDILYSVQESLATVTTLKNLSKQTKNTKQSHSHQKAVPRFWPPHHFVSFSPSFCAVFMKTGLFMCRALTACPILAHLKWSNAWLTDFITLLTAKFSFTEKVAPELRPMLWIFEVNSLWALSDCTEDCLLFLPVSAGNHGGAIAKRCSSADARWPQCKGF